MITCAQAMVACLEKEGIDIIFGIPGAAICPFYDALYGSKIRHILVRHEQSAGHCASGYARITRKVAVCVATSGPGALNLLTAVATAYMDSVPLVVITGQVSSEQLGRDVFQEVDITGAAEPFVKHSYLIKSADEVQTVIKQALHIASTGRQGPVIIDVPIDIQRTMVELDYPETVNIRSYNPNIHGHMGQIKKLISAIQAAKKPLICVGGGIFSSHGEGELLALIERCRIPVVTTMMGLGAVSQSHSLNLGMIGMYGDNSANISVNSSDLLILIGARVGDRAIMSPIGLSYDTTIAHLDIDPAEVGKNIRADIPIVGDARDILMELNSRLPEMNCDALAHELTEKQESGHTMLDIITKQLPEGAVVVADVGKNQLYAAKSFGHCARGGRFLTSGGMGTMGYALPAAIGAHLANSEQFSLCICGDGGFQMSMMELATIVENDIDIKIVIMNNHSLGLVQELQQNHYNGREIAVNLDGNPSFSKLAIAYGIESATVSSESELQAVMERFSSKGAFLLEIVGEFAN